MEHYHSVQLLVKRLAKSIMKLVGFTFFLLIGPQVSFAQIPPSWEHLDVVAPAVVTWFDQATLPNGNILIIGTNTVGNPPHLWLEELDPYGRLLRMVETQDTCNPSPQLVLLDNGQFIVYWQGFPKSALLFYDANWNLIRKRTLVSAATPWGYPGYQWLKRLRNGNLLLTGSCVASSITSPQMLWMDSTGVPFQANTYSSQQQSSSYKTALGQVAELANGDLVVACQLRSPWLYHFDANGTFLGLDTLATPIVFGDPDYMFQSFSTTIAPHPDGGFWMGKTRYEFPSSGWMNLTKLDAGGNRVFTKEFSPLPSGAFHYVGTAVRADGSGAIARRVGSISSTYQITGFDAQGDSIWTNEFDGGFLYKFDTTAERGFVLSGQVGSNPYVVRLDSLGRLLQNVVSGNVYLDLDSNCVRNSQDRSLPNWLVKSGSPLAMAITDSSGNYTLKLDSGAYWFSIGDLHSNYGLRCLGLDSFLVTLPNQNDTIDTLDIPIALQDTCAHLFVDITTIHPRICLNDLIVVNYINLGVGTAFGAYIDVQLDSLFTFVSATIPSTNLGGGLIRFQLGDIVSVGAGTFTITAFLSCATVHEEAVCNTATIYPHVDCTALSPQWNGASLVAEGLCILGDTMQFRLSNQGTAAMAVPSGFVVVEDDILRLSGTVQLGVGLDTLIKIPANGSTWSIFATQVPFHPYASIPRAFVEGCGQNLSGSFSTGHVVGHQQDDSEPYFEIDCNIARNSFDPNDKQGFPLGIRADHGILATDALNYLIRFQNTGNDTAYKVVVRDRIPPEFDLSSFRMLASSHPVSAVRIYGDRVVEWVFDPISLPDSSTDLGGSQGFVKFHLDQVPGNAPGTRIDNFVDIFFDFNAAVRTDTAWHTIYENLETLLVFIDAAPPANAGAKLIVYPNPFSDMATFQIVGSKSHRFQMELYNTNGQLVDQRQYHGAEAFQFARHQLPAGLYLFRLSGNDGFNATGRILIENR